MLDSDALADLIAELVGEHVERATAPLIERIAELEARPAPERGEKGDKGDRGDKGDCGVGLAGIFRGDSNSVVVTLSNGEVKDLGSFSGPPEPPAVVDYKYTSSAQEFASRIALSLGKSIEIDA